MNFEMILAANARLSGKKRITPLLNSPFIDELVGRPTYLKAECLQHSGSFKSVSYTHLTLPTKA